MRLFPKFPENTGFWRKWNVFCIMFIGGCLLAGRFFEDVKEDAEKLLWIGGAALALGLIMQFWKGK
jgi:hypothetical protein